MALTGFLRIVGSFFSLPFLFVKNTFAFLDRVGKEGFQKASGDESIPFLNWMFLAGRVLIVGVAAVIVVATAILMLSGYGSDAGDFILGLILGAVLAFVWIWICALWLEILSLGVVLINNTKEIIKNTTPKESA